MGKRAKVSIILVNYNGYKDTIECLESLRKITYPNYEITIIDNASTNDSVKHINKVLLPERENIIVAEVNAGFSAGNNIGIKYAISRGSEYMLLLNNDTVVEPDFLDKLIEGFQFSSNCGLTIGKILYERNRNIIWYGGGDFNKKTGKTEHWSYNTIDTSSPLIPQSVSFATGCCMCLSKRVIEDVGFMDEGYFLYEEDVDYCLRLINSGYEILYVPTARIYHKVNASTGLLSGISQYYMIRNKYLLIEKFFHGSSKLIAITRATIQFLFRCIKKELEFKYLRKAYIAYKRHETGKTKGSI